MFKSTDAGDSWRSVGPQNVWITAFAIDPHLPSTMYASGGVAFNGYYLFKSLDGGDSWNQLVIRRDGFPEPYVSALSVDPTNPSILYVAGNRLIKSTNGGRDWVEIDNGLPLNAAVAIYALAIDPASPSTIYVALNGNFTRPGVYRSTDAGLTWAGRYNGMLYGTTQPATLAMDTLTPSTLYSSLGGPLFKSTNSGKSWIETKLQGRILSMAVAPGDPSKLYVGSQQGLFKSDDGGLSSRPLMDGVVLSIAIDAKTPSNVYVGSAGKGADAFVAKLHPTGSPLVYSTYVGGNGDESGNAIAVDSSGNAYVTGETRSTNWMVANAFQPNFGGGSLDSSDGYRLSSGDAFVIKLNASGSALYYSSYLGSIFGEKGSGIALDSSGNVYVSGGTESFDFPTTPGVFQTAGRLGYKAFVIKIGVPRIVSVSIAGNKMIVRGEAFDAGAVVLVDGMQQRTIADDANPTTVLVAKKVLGKIAPGQSVSIQVRNADSTLSNEFAFTRSFE